MLQSPSQRLNLEEFLALPDRETGQELVDGEAIPKVSPKRFHSRTQRTLLLILMNWCQQRGEIGVEWAVALKRSGVDWVPVPDLLYISFNRLSPDWQEDAPCPIPPELAIEIISPDQTFGEMAEKATDYLSAGVLRVWIVDPRARSITVFYPDAAPRTYTDTTPLTDDVLPELQLTAQQLFQQAGLSR